MIGKCRSCSARFRVPGKPPSRQISTSPPKPKAASEAISRSSKPPSASDHGLELLDDDAPQPLKTGPKSPAAGLDDLELMEDEAPSPPKPQPKSPAAGLDDLELMEDEAPPPPKPQPKSPAAGLDDLELMEDEAPPPPKPRPKPQPAPDQGMELVDDDTPPPSKTRPKSKPADVDDLELIDDETPPPPKTRPKPQSAPVHSRERIQDGTPPPAKALPKAKRPAAPPPEPDDVEELEVIEEEPRRKPAPRSRDGITRDPLPGRKARIADVDELPDDEEDEEDFDEDRAERRKAGRKKRRSREDSRQMGATTVFVVAGVAVVLWLVLTPAAFFFKPVSIALLVFGAICGFVSRLFFIRIARRELGSMFVLLNLIPLYDVYYFFTRISKMLFPFILWVCAVLFLISGGISLGFHNFRESGSKSPFTRSGTQSGQPFGIGFDDDGGVALAPKTAKELDAEPARLMAKNRIEARAFSRTAAFRRMPGSKEATTNINDAYNFGAKEVWVAGLDPDELRCLVVVLPADAPSRKRLFAWYQRIDPDAIDLGQKYLLLAMDE
jgi:hypothetical protein